MNQVKANFKNNEAQIQQMIAATFSDLHPTAVDFITAWAFSAERYGAEVASVHAAYELRAAGRCDSKANANTIAYRLGIEQGIAIVKKMEAWAVQQVSSCLINVEAIAKQVRAMARGKISSYMEEHKVCEDADLSSLNQALMAAEDKRKEGIQAGIEQEVTVLTQKLWIEHKRVCTAAGPGSGTGEVGGNWAADGTCPNIGCKVTSSHEGKQEEINGNCVCCRIRNATKSKACVGKSASGEKTYCRGAGKFYPGQEMMCGSSKIALGSPIVVDLGGDGLTLSGSWITFDLLADGNPQQCTWVGRDEGLLALDLNGDGQVGSGAELFGNHTDCGGARCYDGVAALKRWDRPDRGGNGDGLIDSKDMVFSRLLIWTDGDQNGRSSQEELTSLEDHGILAFNLNTNYATEHREAGAVTAKLSLLKDSGFGDAYEVWFKLRAGTKSLRTLFPPQ
jgi:hypothetical protein